MAHLANRLAFAILPVPMSILINFLLGIYAFVALLMILVILMQRPKSEGLGAAFGGGVTENLFGATTTNVLTKFTGWLAGFFFSPDIRSLILYAHKEHWLAAISAANWMKGQPSAATLPAAKPQPSSAVGAPGTVTNPTPGAATAGAAPPARPADLAVGAVLVLNPLRSQRLQLPRPRRARLRHRRSLGSSDLTLSRAPPFAVLVQPSRSTPA